MNVVKKAYCRIFQGVFKIALPLLPYKDPKRLDKLTDVADTLTQNGKHKPLIVTDKKILSLNLTEPLTQSLTEHGIEYVLYDGVVANPTTDNVDAALTLYRENGCDSLVAFGGGSPMHPRPWRSPWGSRRRPLQGCRTRSRGIG